MKLHEYQAHKLLRDFGVPSPEGEVVFDVSSAVEAYNRLGSPVVLKAQVLCGGRGKAGGVRLAKTAEEVERAAAALFSLQIKGFMVEALLIQKAVDFDEEIFFSLSMDRSSKCPCVIVSPHGGVDIETLALEKPESIYRIPIDPIEGITPQKSLEIAEILAYSDGIQGLRDLINKLYSAFVGLDALLIEINPLVRTPRGDFLALDAKIILDENGLYRHPQLDFLTKDRCDDPLLARAKELGISFLPLQGEIGCIVNGAGLAMATMDAILARGASPANFLDVGGSSNMTKIEVGFELILRNANVKAIIINIFGGITRCDEIARGVIIAKKKLNTSVPIFARMKGTNSESALKILSSADIVTSETMDELIETATSFLMA